MAKSPASGKPKDIHPYPITQNEREAAKLLHLKAKQEKKRIPYFIKNNDPTDIYYFDNKGKGKLGLNNLNTKLTNEAGRAANKKNLTPTLAMYIEEFGEEKGKILHQLEYDRVKAIYKKNNPLTHDVDHIISQADKGVHGSRNLRSQELSLNRSEGARGRLVPEETYKRWNTDLMVGGTPRDYIRMQGPVMTGEQTINYLAGKPLNKNNKMKVNGNGNGNGNGKLNGKVNGRKNGKLNGGVLGAASKTRKVDAAANILANTATGAYGAAAVGGGALVMTQALQNRKTQQAIGKQIGKLVSKRAGRTMMKAVPGLDIFLSGQESLDYLKRGKLDQAGIAALSGAIGWIPVIGDGISASLDLTNTGIDISRLQMPTGTSKKKGVKGSIRRPKPRI
mgnify:CR=1 FL=1|tara:strand:- start:14 stop:1192 length:1179 start_codon:yes stop_codon:yes gene_type:complete